MIPVPSHRPNPSSISDSKGALTYSKLSHPDAQRHWTNMSMMVAMISPEESCSFQVFLRSGLAVRCLSRKPLPQKASAGDLYDSSSLHKSSILMLEFTL
ncbi:hypothetical protein CHARACLAT_010681 [Characodon lateralis]|uniref:Uncharacterized protein n=1 Tax=Characodon lateralis TaxID=208331 RepID=A0ABU7DFY2_9TELE|nr:hypothetical protein [Characodon lateralis]